MMIKRITPKRLYDNTSRKMKQAGLPAGVRPIRKGAWQEAREAGYSGEEISVSGAPKNNTRALALSDGAMLAMAQDKAAGLTNIQLAHNYAVSEEYVAKALNTLFVSSKQGREILKGVLLDNAIATGMKARRDIEQLSPMQAVVASGIMTQRYIDLDKHTANVEDPIDISEIERVGRKLKEFENIVGIDAESLGSDVIDVSGDE